MPGDPRGLFACLRSSRPDRDVAAIAREFSPRFQRYGPRCVVMDVSGLERLFGSPDEIAAALWTALGGVNEAGFEKEGPAEAGHDTPIAASSRYGIRIHAHPRDHAGLCFDRFQIADLNPSESVHIREDPRAVHKPESVPVRIRGCGLALAPTQSAALLLAHGCDLLTVAAAGDAEVLCGLPLGVLQLTLAEVHGVPAPIPGQRARPPAMRPQRGWPSWEATEVAFDVLHRWGIRTLGELAALPPGDLASRMGQDGVALQRIARGIDPRPLVPDPDAPRFCTRMELEWPIDTLEPLSFVLARLLDPLAAALERADRSAAVIRLDLRLVDRTTHGRVLQLPAALRDPRVLRTLLLLDLESHPPAAAIDVVSIEIDPAPGRILQYSLLERAVPSAETLATLMARLGALVGDSRCGSPALIESNRPDAFEMRPFAPEARAGAPIADGHQRAATGTPCVRRFRPPVAVRVTVERGRPVRLAIDRRGMPGGGVVQAAGPWRSSGAWWGGAHWDRDEWDVALTDGAICRLYCARGTGGWFLEGVLD